MTTQHRLTAAVLFVALAFQVVLLPVVGPVGLGVFGIAVLIGWGIIWQRGLLRPAHLLLLALSLLASVGLIWRANEFLQVYFFLVFWVCQALLYVHFIWPAFNTAFSRVATGLVHALPRQAKTAFNLFRFRPTASTGSGSLISWLKSLLLVTIVVGIFAVLLSQADVLFAQTLRNLNITTLVSRVIWFAVIALGTLVLWSTPKDESQPKPINLRWFSARDLTLIMVGLLLLFGAFLSIQWQYLFAGSQELLVELNLTLSQYVRKGFLELLFVVLLGSVIVYLGALKIRTPLTRSARVALQVVTAFGVVELFLLLASALKRDLLYVDTYGVTRMRIVGEIFLVWLALCLALLLLFVVIRKVQEQLVYFGFLAVTLLASGYFLLSNMDQQLLAAAPSHHEYTDYFYLSNLSADAGSALFSDVLPGITADVQELLAKDELDEVEQSQLAGLKLALWSLREQRNRALLQATPSEFLFEHDRQLGFSLSPDYDELSGIADHLVTANTVKSQQLQLGLGESLAAKATMSSSVSPQLRLPAFIKRNRSWQRQGISQRQFNRYVVEHPELLQTIDELLLAIREYQLQHQLSLWEQESLLVSKLQYPLVDLKINGSYVEGMYEISLLEQSEQRANDTLLGRIEAESAVVQSVTTDPCRSLQLGSEKERLYGFLESPTRTIGTDATTGYWFHQISRPDVGRIAVVANEPARNSLATTEAMHALPTSPTYAMIEITGGQTIIGTEASSCVSRYTLLGWQPLKVLSL